ncbi:hypothetical protein [Microbulbifer halophilus]
MFAGLRIARSNLRLSSPKPKKNCAADAKVLMSGAGPPLITGTDI